MTCPFKIGDRVRWKQVGNTLSAQPEMTVTEITRRGFKYKLDRPIYMGRPYYGTWTEGECLAPEYYELIPPGS